MLRLAALFVLLAAALPARAQTVRLTLLDHVVGTEIVNDAPLPAGTDVFVVSKGDPRSVRLRSGYGEVAAALPTARRDRLGAGGRTEGAYQPTARSRRSYFVVARLPDGRLFQSYVKTADAGWQPGFDAVSGGRVSMGRATGAAEQALRAALPSVAAVAPAAPRRDTATARPSALPAAPPASGPTPAQRDSIAADSVRRAALLGADSLAGAMAAYDTTLLDTSGGLVPTATPTDDADLVADTEGDGGPVWPWALGGLLVGAALAAAVLMPLERRRLQRQREHLLRLVPDPDARAAAEAERTASLDARRAADSERFDSTMMKIDTLRAMLRDRDDEIRRLRTGETPPRPPQSPPNAG